VQEAKEVAQEAYVRLLSLEDSGAVSFLRAFLFKTAANLAVDRIRSRNRQRQALDAGLCDEAREAPRRTGRLRARRKWRSCGA
jgi:DNA-directed RNA polymerase specialized sigma24 family protein